MNRAANGMQVEAQEKNVKDSESVIGAYRHSASPSAAQARTMAE